VFPVDSKIIYTDFNIIYTVKVNWGGILDEVQKEFTDNLSGHLPVFHGKRKRK
jgi:hypothetical protein